jgi:carbamate kinase
MRPKVEAAVAFGGEALITNFDTLEASLRGEGGTRIGGA